MGKTSARRRTRQPLGQHFLTSDAHLQAIASLVGAEAGERVLEIGPGKGALTGKLLERGLAVTAVERDRSLLPFLETLGLDLLPGDALEEPPDLRTFLPRHSIRWVAGNLPYYVSTAILRRYLPSMDLLDGMVFTFQKEVAERVTAGEGTRPYGALSVASQVFSRPVLERTIPPGAFSPPPAVESAVVSFHPTALPPLRYESFEAFLFLAFKQPRKRLSNNLKSFAPDLAARVGDARPGDLSPADYVDLFLTQESSP